MMSLSERSFAMDLCDIREIRPLLERHGFRFSRSMGQNFLIDGRVPRDIAAASGADGGTGVLEIGPGIGCLTVQLAARAGRVACVELDRSLLPVLSETLAGLDHVTVIPGDILKLDLERLVAEQFPDLQPTVCANLPYNITTPVLTRLIDSGLFASLTVMIQREVAQRICAQPGTADYGAFSVYCQYHTRPELLFQVPPDCFLPAPKVTSAVVRLIPRAQPPVPVDDPALFFRVVRAAFALRRKTLLNCLSAAFSPQLSKQALRDILARCGLPETVRGEQLGIPQFAQLARALAGQDPR